MLYNTLLTLGGERLSVTIDEFKATEEILTKYFNDIKALNIWKASICSMQERKERLEERIYSGIPVIFTDNVKSQVLSSASPSNRQPPKGLDACIDRASELQDKLIVELHTTEIDLIVTEEGIKKLEQETVFVSEVIKALSDESRKIIEMKFDKKKSFDDIGEVLKKSKSAVHDFYRKIINDICKWLKYMNLLDEVK